MKKIVFFVLAICVVAVPFLLGASGAINQSRSSPAYGSSPASPWIHVGTLTNDVNYPAVNERSCATQDPNTNLVIWKIPEWATRGMVKFETAAEADSHVIYMMASAGLSGKQYTSTLRQETDDYAYAGKVTLTGGTQVGHGNVYVDTIVVNETGVLGDILTYDSGKNRICTMEFDTKGFKQLAFVQTTDGAAPLKIMARWW